MSRFLAPLFTGLLFSVNVLADAALLQALQDEGVPLTAQQEAEISLATGDDIPDAIAGVVSSFPKDKSLVESTIAASIMVAPDQSNMIIYSSKKAAPSASPGIKAGAQLALGHPSAFGRAIASVNAGFDVPPGNPGGGKPSPN